MTEFSLRIIDVISQIEVGKVMSYKEVALLAGNGNGARQVARILHTCSKKHNLPWWRVVNSNYQVSIKDPYGFEEQVMLLRSEGLEVLETGKILLKD